MLFDQARERAGVVGVRHVDLGRAPRARAHRRARSAALSGVDVVTFGCEQCARILQPGGRRGGGDVVVEARRQAIEFEHTDALRARRDEARPDRARRAWAC